MSKRFAVLGLGLSCYLAVINACPDATPVAVTPMPCTRDVAIVCELQDGAGTLFATHASKMPEGGWEVLGDILVSPGSEWEVVNGTLVIPKSNDAYTIPGPTEIAPGSQCVVIE